MSIQFDHFVLLVHDLAEATRDFEALGFTVQERADTEHGKTRFRFVCFDDGSYILLTAFASPEDQAAHRLGCVLDAGEGWADWSFCLPDVTATGAALTAAGMPAKGPVRVSNVIENGDTWALDLLMTGRGAEGDVCLPFVISDVEGRAARIPAPRAHANGATGLIGLTISTGDADTVGATLAALGGRETGPGLFDFGRAWVEVLPLDAPEARPGGGMVTAVLSGAQDLILDAALSHGAPMRISRI